MRTPHLALLVCGLSIALPAQEGDAEKLRQEAQMAAQEQRWEDAASAFGKLVEVAPKDAQAWHMLGYTLHASGELDKALKAHIKATEFDQTRPVASYNVACVHALQGNKDKAIEWLNKAAEAGFNNVSHLDTDPDMDSLRDDPRYKKAIEAMSAAGDNYGAGKMQVWASEGNRKDFRVLFWRGQSSPGQIVVNYGTPKWDDKYTEQLESDRAIGRRWRLGQNFWTTIDTNVDLEIADVDVPAGYYYLTLEQVEKGVFHLALLDPAKVRGYKTDAFLAHQTKGGIEVPMTFAKSEKTFDELTISMKASGTEGKLMIGFGPYTLTAPVAMHVE